MSTAFSFSRDIDVAMPQQAFGGQADVYEPQVNMAVWQPALSEDVAALVDMFGCLSDSELVGLRLRTLSSAMCPKFHFDRVPCRLVMTYKGSK